MFLYILLIFIDSLFQFSLKQEIDLSVASPLVTLSPILENFPALILNRWDFNIKYNYWKKIYSQVGIMCGDGSDVQGFLCQVSDIQLDISRSDIGEFSSFNIKQVLNRWDLYIKYNYWKKI